MQKAVKTVLRFMLLSAVLVVPAVLLWQSGSEGGRIWPVLDFDRGWYGLLLSAWVRRPALDVFMFYADIPLLFVVVIAATRIGLAQRYAVALGALGYLLLAAFQAYHQLSWWLQQQPPMFVSDLPLLNAAKHFLQDLGTEWLVAGAVLALLGCGLLVMGTARVLAGLIRDSRVSAAPYLVSLGLVAYAASLTIIVGSHRNDTVGKWLSKALYENVHRSLDHLDFADQLGAMPSDDRYHHLLARPAQRTPSVLLYVMESYGDILITDPRFRANFGEVLQAATKSFTAMGWHSAHSVSTSPVHGGKSWYSSATLLSGLKIAHASHFQKFLASSGDYPHLVRWFAASGYQTYGLLPGTKARHELPEANTYDFDHYLTAEQIPYEGQAHGWAGLPDQFALGYGVERLLSDRVPGTPQFMMYSSVSSHAPWRQPLSLAADWRQSGQAVGGASEAAQAARSVEPVKAQILNALNFRLKRSLLSEDLSTHYVGQIAYQWAVIEQLAARQDNPFDLIIVIGDHPPPLLGNSRKGMKGKKGSESFNTPIHVLAKDKALIQTLLSGGFAAEPGQLLTAKPIRHEGFYQLVADVLNQTQPEVASAAWQQGATLGALKF